MDETRDISVEKSRGVLVKSKIDAEGDVFVGGDQINLYVSADYQQILERIKELEADLEDIPEEKVERRLKKSAQLEEQRKRKKDFEQDTIRLVESFSKIEINTERLKKARDFFKEGKLREADAILKAEEMGREQEKLLAAKDRKTGELEEINTQLKSNADEFLIKAQTRATQYDKPGRFEEASRYYKQSIRSFPDFNNHFQYAYFLAEHNQNNKAATFYQKAIEVFGATLTTELKATTLNNLGVLQADMNDPEAALKSYTEALKIRRKLASTNPQTYLPNVAATLNNLGALQAKGNVHEAALKSYTEALETYRELASSNPRTYLSYVATTLNNLGILQKDSNNQEAALKSYTEALEIRRELAPSNPRTYLPDVATTLNNLGNLQVRRNDPETAGNDYEAALKSYFEALEILRELARTNPETYLSDVATTLNNLGTLQQRGKDPDAALNSYTEALETYRELASANAITYLPYVAATLNNLGALQAMGSDLEEPMKSFMEALEIRRKLATSNPMTHLPDVAMTLINMSHYYQHNRIDEEKSVTLAIEAIIILEPLLKKIPFTSKYMMTAIQVLEKWGMSDEKIEKRLEEWPAL